MKNAHHTVLHTGRRKDTFSDLPVRSRGVPDSVGVYVTQAKILRIVFQVLLLRGRRELFLIQKTCEFQPPEFLGHPSGILGGPTDEMRF